MLFLAILSALVVNFTTTVTSYSSGFSLSSDYRYRVDLGYQVNQGHGVVNNTLVTFRNVRYAAPPLGPLRFLAPTPPPVNRTGIQNASDVICPQSFPWWYTTRTLIPFRLGDISPVDPRTSEDCLFLDVLLPKRIWERRQHIRAPVLVWIYGGGLDHGWKDLSGRGYGLVSRSHHFGRQGVILVSVNYRLGLFGWMNGPNVTSNAGLLDQRFALDWVQKYIHLFGGDPSRVTIFGESSGGSSIEAHITAYGGTNGPSPFKGAIPQSPFYPPITVSPDSQVDAVLKFGNISSLDTLRQMSSAGLQTLNTLLVGNSQPFGTFTFGIVPDDDYVPHLPSELFKQGRFDRTISVMTGINADEGSFFAPNKLATDETSYVAFLRSFIPQLANSTTHLDYITKELYPPIFDGSQIYTNQMERNNITIADMTIVCNARFLHQVGFLPSTYAYEYSAQPTVHGADVRYTFYDFGPVAGINTTLAEIMQGYLTRFAETGQPNAPSLPYFPPARPGLTVQNLGIDFVGPIRNRKERKLLLKRCRFWQYAPYLVNN